MNRTDRTILKWILLIFAFSFVIRLFFVFGCFPFEYAQDEFSTLSNAGLLYPLHWENVFSDSIGYYGGGFSSLFAVFFYIFKDPVTIYRACLVTLSVLQAAGSVIAFIILKKHLKLNSNVLSAVIAVASGFMVTRRSVNITNESVLYFLIWLIVLLLFELADSDLAKWKKRGLSVTLAAVMGYALSVHERMLVLIPLMILLWVMYLIAYKRSIVSPFFFIPSYAVVFFLARMLKNAIIQMNFSGSAGVTNSEVSTGNLKLLTSSYYWKPYLTAVTGTLTTSGLITFGLVLCGIVLFFICMYKGFFRKAELRAGENSHTDLSKKMFLGIIFLGAGIIAISLYQPVSSIRGLAIAMEEGWDTSYYAFKIVTYVRYYGVFLPPLCMLIMHYLLTGVPKKTFKIAAAAAVTGAALNAFWLIHTYRYVRFSRDAAEAWDAFGFGLEAGEEAGSPGFLIGSVILFAILIVLVLLVRFKKTRALVIIICAFAVWQYCERSVNFDLARAEYRSVQTNTYRMLEGSGIVSLAGEVCAPTLPTVYQLLYYDQKVSPQLPDPDVEEGIVIAGKYSLFAEALEHGWKIVDPADDTDAVFVKGSRLFDALTESGCTLIDYIPKKYVVTKEDFVNQSEHAVIMDQGIRLPSGTYELTFDSSYASRGDYRVGIKTNVNHRFFCRRVLFDTENGVIRFSLFRSSKIYVRIVNGEDAGAVAAPEEMTIRKVSDVAEVGISSPDHTETIGSILKKNKITEAVYLKNTDVVNDLSALRKASGCEFTEYNEAEIRAAHPDVIVADADDDWLYFTDSYELKKLNGSFALLFAKKEGADPYFDIKEDGKLGFGLAIGEYRFRYVPETKESIKDAQPYFVLKGRTSGINIEVKLRAYRDGDAFTTQVKINSPFKRWRVGLYDGSGNELPCSSTELQKTESTCMRMYAGCGDKLAELINGNNYADDVYIRYVKSHFGEKLTAHYIESGIKTEACISYDAKNGGEIPGAGLVVIPRSSRELYSYVDEGYRILDTVREYVYLCRGDIKMTGSPDAEAYQEGKKILGNYYYGDGQNVRINVPAGAYKIRLSDDPEGRVTLLSGNSVLKTYDNAGTELCFNTLRSLNNIRLTAEDGTDLKDRIGAIEKVSWLDTCEIEEDGSRLRLISGGMSVRKEKTYYAELVFKGTPVSAVLSSKDYAHSVVGENSRTEEAENMGGDMYEMVLRVRPSQERAYDRIVFEAEFEGKGGIVSFDVREATGPEDDEEEEDEDGEEGGNEEPDEITETEDGQ